MEVLNINSRADINRSQPTNEIILYRIKSVHNVIMCCYYYFYYYYQSIIIIITVTDMLSENTHIQPCLKLLTSQQIISET